MTTNRKGIDYISSARGPIRCGLCDARLLDVLSCPAGDMRIQLTCPFCGHDTRLITHSDPGAVGAASGVTGAETAELEQRGPVAGSDVSWILDAIAEGRDPLAEWAKRYGL